MSSPASARSTNLGRILIVDDSPEMRLALSLCLRKRGWHVCEAEHGLKAVEMLDREPPDLLILDQRMPHMTGEQVYVEMRRRGLTIPVVLVTAATEVRELAERLGIDCYVGKPFHFDALLAMISRALAGGEEQSHEEFS